MADITDPFNKVSNALKPGGNPPAAGQGQGASSSSGYSAAPDTSSLRVLPDGNVRFTMYKKGGKTNESIEVEAKQVEVEVDGQKKFMLQPVAVFGQVFNGAVNKEVRVPIPEGTNLPKTDIITVIERGPQRWITVPFKEADETGRSYRSPAAVLSGDELKSMGALARDTGYLNALALAENKSSGISSVGRPVENKDGSSYIPMKRGEEDIRVFLNPQGKVTGVEFNIKDGKGTIVPVTQTASINTPENMGKMIGEAEKRKGQNAAMTPMEKAMTQVITPNYEPPVPEEKKNATGSGLASAPAKSADKNGPALG